MKFLSFEFDFAPPHKTVNEGCKRKNFLIAGRILPNFFRKLYSSSTGMHALLMAMMSLFLFSCDDPGQTMDDITVSDEWRSMPDLNTLSKEELVEYFKEYKFGERGSPPMSIEITDVEGLPATPKIKTRNSAKCDLEITLLGGPPSSTDSATLELYENDILMDSYTLYDKVKIFVEIDDANEYKYKIIPLGDVSNPKFYFQVGLKYGSLWVYNIDGEYTTQPFNYTCPEPTGGMCEVEWTITKYAGSATHYEVYMIPTDNYYPAMKFDTLYPGVPVSLTRDSNRDYNILIYPSPGSSLEFFRFMTSTPYLNVALMFDLDMTDPNQQEGFYPNFDYYDCP